MDDATIAKIRTEVLSQLETPASSGEAGADLEARVQALESAVAQLLSRAPRSLPVVAEAPRAVAPHPAFVSLDLGPKGEGCVLEPGKPCVQSHACRTFGH